jgi:formylglycine-generating enzyme required for sulfatase activity/uncharacterized caspase-like protein
MGKNWAIAIGINAYDNLNSLKYAKQDAEAVKAWIEDPRKGGFDKVFLFTEDSPAIATNPPISTQPTFGRLRRFLEKQFEQPLLKPGDNLWFFFAGHGKRYADKDYLMLTDTDPNAVEYTALAVSWVTERLCRSGADNVVLFLDACRNDGSRSGLGIGYEQHQGIITFYSCTANQQSFEIDELQHGSFTHALLEGLQHKGEANCATVERLDRHLSHQIPQINATYRKPIQNPYLKAEPPYKLKFILLEQIADLEDAQPLKWQASLAENRGELQVAKQLWIRVLAVSRGDEEAIEAIERIAIKQSQTPPAPKPQPVIIPSGERSSISTPPEEEKLKVFEFDVVAVNAQGQEIQQNKGQAKYFTENLGDDVTLDMVYIPGGEFLMGTEDEEIERLNQKYQTDWFNCEKPQHKVTVPPFFMGKYPITQAHWKAIASRTDLKIERDLKPEPSYFQGNNNRPVESVSWYDAVEFCARLSKLTKQEYRLPSEAEWEYTCRAGTTTPFYFGETITADLANYNCNYTYGNEVKGKYRQETTPVGSFPPNAFGLYDMHGNVWEWCADSWHGNYAGAPVDGGAWITGGNDNRSPLRGGSWYGNPYSCRSAYRFYSPRDSFYNVIGFRVVCVFGRT